MLSYQHGFHAGNRADVLKHSVLHALLTDMSRTGGPYLYVETHSGRGRYDLEGQQARKGNEAASGILSMMGKRGPRPLHAWTEFVEQCGIRRYPGSPAHAQSLLPRDTRYVLFEKHPAEFDSLSATFKSDDRFQIRKSDGYAGALKLAPRHDEHLICFVDPSYETERDIDALAEWAPRALKRWQNTTLILWLPLFRDGRELDFGEYLTTLGEGFVAGARWPVDPLHETALEGSAMVVYSANQAIADKCIAIASSLQSWWSDKPL